MYRQLYVLFFLSIFAIACNKEPETNRSLLDIAGLQTQTLDLGDTSLFTVHISQRSGTPQPISLSFSGLPNGIIYWFSDPTGSDKFSSIASMHATIHAMPGIYHAQLVCSFGAGSQESFPITVEIPNTTLNSVGGIWNVMETGTDENANQILDSGETSVPLDVFVSYTFHYTRMGNIRIRLADGSWQQVELSWSLSANEKILNLVSGSSSEQLTIHQLEGRYMTLRKDNTWMVLRKQ